MTIQYEVKIIRTLEVPDNLSIDEIDERVNEDMQNINPLQYYTSLSIYYDSSKVINDNGEDEDDENPLKAIIDAIIDEDKDF